jgi:hypothetical protein
MGKVMVFGSTCKPCKHGGGSGVWKYTNRLTVQCGGGKFFYSGLKDKTEFGNTKNVL